MSLLRPVGITEFEDRNWELEETYWWFVGRRRILAAVLEASLPPHPQRLLLDVGCGPGVTMNTLKEFGLLVGLDRSRKALEKAKERGHRWLLYGNATTLPFPSGCFDGVTLLDVLEHIPDDWRALEEIRRVLKPGGFLLLTVPAYQFLWSEHDEALQHCRRYVAGQIRRRLEGTGYRLRRLTYAITLLAPLIALFRLGQRVWPRRGEPRAAILQLPPWLNRFCQRTLEWEARWLQRRNFSYGITILALAEKG